ncbi:MAG TPA: RNB domain-containing ribonuclease [Anaerolineales bacterium]|nr:RNB domain-containing ribonuclease [Anaerolineales bacterium]
MMEENQPLLHSLVLYRKRPARVAQVQPRLEIELEDGNRAKVRPKDISILHPGPFNTFKELTPVEGEVELAWQILNDDTQNQVSLAELADIIYGSYSPASAWSAWKLVEEGLFFTGSTEAISACSLEAIQKERANRLQRETEAQAWNAFIKRIELGQIIPDQDANFLREVEDLAFGRRSNSRVLRAIGRTERPENAHALLLSSGFWGPDTNPYPTRYNLPTNLPELAIPELADEPRLDLTHLEAYAIDDALNQDPDDAISLVSIQKDTLGNFVKGQVWVHIADAACLVHPDSPLDLEARSRGATLYLPERTVTMLPHSAIRQLGLGLQEPSPALSFQIEINRLGEITCNEIRPTWVKVKRVSYEQAETLLEQEPINGLHSISQVYKARREMNGALFIDLPEVNIHVMNGEVEIRPLNRLESRAVVREAMLMAGEAAAQFALREGLPFPYATQKGPDSNNHNTHHLKSSNSPSDLAGFFELRSKLRRSQVSSQPAPHAGVGLSAYSRATSPLRRYLDLTVHQQLRAFLSGRPPLNEQEMLARVGMSEAVTSSVNAVENLSRRHWTLVYLQQHPEWQGEAILVEKTGLRGRVILPELAFDSLIHLREDIPLNTSLQVEIKHINLAELEATLKIL